MRFRYNQLAIINQLSLEIRSRKDKQYNLKVSYPDEFRPFNVKVSMTDIDIAQAVRHCIEGNVTDRGFTIEAIEHYSKKALIHA